MLSTAAGLRGVIDSCGAAGLGKALQYPYVLVWYWKLSGITVFLIGDENIVKLGGTGSRLADQLAWLGGRGINEGRNLHRK